MSLEAALETNTAVMRELIAALTAAGALQTAQASAAAHSSPAVQAVVKAQKAADAKKSEKVATATDATPAAETAPSASGEQSAPTGESSSSEPTDAVDNAPNDRAAGQTAKSAKPSASESPSNSECASTELQPWAEKTAAKFAELKDAAPNIENVRKAVLGINSLIGREQATAVLGRFGVQAVTPKDNKKGLDESQYEKFFELCLEVLSGKVDATASMASE
jgi:hypothetical protein